MSIGLAAYFVYFNNDSLSGVVMACYSYISHQNLLSSWQECHPTSDKAIYSQGAVFFYTVLLHYANTLQP